MGMKKIAEKEAELRKKNQALETFLKTAATLQEALTKVQKLGEDAEKAYTAMYDKKKQMTPVIEKLDTHGIKEFEQYKAHLLAVATNKAFQDRLLPTAPLQKVVDTARSEVRTMLNEWLEKQASSMPKEWKKGMSFRDYDLDRVYELISDVEQAKNVNLKGDDALWFNTKFTDLKTGKEGTVNVSKGSLLKRKLKFLKM